MNKNFDENLNIDFEQAYNLIKNKFEHFELIKMLEVGNIQEKQFAALELSSINNQKEVDILLSNLTGCDGKIRESVALKINQLLYEDKTFINLSFNPKTFADATIDINGNICRLVIDSVSILKKDDHFSKNYLQHILNFIEESFLELDRFIFKDKKYVINKQLFKLYWCLEALKLFINDIDENVLYNILERAVREKEYTIREKVAQILNNISSDRFKNLNNLLKNDENYYVKTVFKN